MTEKENKGTAGTGAVITIDVAAIPKSLDVDKWLYLWHEFGTIFYDSTQGLKPTVLEESSVQIAVIDTSDDEGKEKLAEKLKESRDENDNREA